MTRVSAVLIGAALVLLGIVQYWTLTELHDLRTAFQALPVAVRQQPENSGPLNAPGPDGVSESRQRKQESPRKGNIISLAGSHQKGSSTAKVALIEFSDFQCPYCGAFATRVLPAIEREFIKTGRVVLAYRHMPLLKIHPDAQAAAVAANCAGDQGKFWEMHDKMFGRQRELTLTVLSEHANALGLDMRQFDACLARSDSRVIDSDLLEAGRFNVTGTPTFLVGALQPNGQVIVRQRITGAQAADQFRQAIERVESELRGSS